MKKETAVAVTATTVVAVAAATHLVSEDLEIIPAAVLSGSSSFYSSAETTAGPEAPAEMTAETETAAGSLSFFLCSAAITAVAAAADTNLKSTAMQITTICGAVLLFLKNVFILQAQVWGAPYRIPPLHQRDPKAFPDYDTYGIHPDCADPDARSSL